MLNLKLAIRALLASPFVTTVAILSLALGIGANAAIFSLFDQMLLRPMAVHEPERLVNLVAPGPKPGSNSCNQAGPCEAVFSYPMFRDLERAGTFAGLAAHRSFDANLAFRGNTINAEGMLVSGSYFPLLGLAPTAGRLLTPADDETIGGQYVAVLSHGYWENQLGGDPGIVGQAITINGQPMTIVGVAPRGFEGTTLGARPRVFVPLTLRSVVNRWFTDFEDRRNYWAYVFGRLQPGATMEQAERAVNAVYQPIVRDVEAPIQTGMSDQAMTRFVAKSIVLEPGQRGQSSIHTESRTPLILLFAIAGIVLLTACANIANLLLVRGASRAGDMAVRLSLGATRGRLLGQLLTESLVLAVLGGIVSLVIAHWTLAGIAALLPPEASAVLQVRIDGTVVLFAAATSVFTGIAFGLFPALNSTRPDLIQTIRSSAGQLTGVRSAARFRASLATAQVALAMTLLVSAGLFIRSLVHVTREELGIRIENVVTFGVSPEQNGHPIERSLALFQDIERELAALPGVSGVTASLVPILAGNNWTNNVSVEGFRRDPDTSANANFNMIGPGYFRVLGVPVLAGREFTESDIQATPRVAIVNEEFTRRFGLGRDAVGKRMAVGNTDQLEIEIIDMVGDTKYNEVRNEIAPLYFTPYRQALSFGVMTFYVRAAMQPEQVLRSIPSLVARLDPDLPVTQLKTMPQQVRENTFMDRIIGTLAASFAALATLLAAVGLYGVLAYTVARRTREFGIRLALGASSGNLRGLVFRQVGWMLLGGGLIGLAAAIALGRAARSLLFELEAHDPVTILAAVALLGAVAVAAGYVPAHRAASVEPMRALRAE